MIKKSDNSEFVIPLNSFLGVLAGQINPVPHLVAVSEVQLRLAIDVVCLDLDRDALFDGAVESPEHDALGGQLEADSERVGVYEHIDLAGRQQRLFWCC